MTNHHDTSLSARTLRTAVAAALAAFLIAPAAVQANDPTQKTKAAGVQGEAAMVEERNFFTDAVRGSEKEIAAARLARQHASNDRVRDMADKLERDHQALLGRLRDTSVALGIRDVGISEVALASTGSTGSQYSGVRDDISGSAGQSAGSTASASGSAMASGTTAGDTGTASDVAAGNDAAIASGATGSGATATTAMGDTARGDAYADTARAGKDKDKAKWDKSAKAGKKAGSAKTDDELLRQHPDLVSLSQRTGSDFDRAFLSQMVTDHQRSVDKFTKASSDMSLSPQVRTLASQSLPTLRSHLEMSRMLRDDLQQTRIQ